MSDSIVAHFQHPHDHDAMRRNAIARAAQYEAEPIMNRFLTDLGLADALQRRVTRSDAVVDVTEFDDVPKPERSVA
jgi:hypothetical protein